MSSTNKKIIISGGGTGGHVFPAIAIANALKKIDANVEILFVGAYGKMEMEKVPQAGYEIKGLHIAGFQRSFSLQNLIFPFKLIFSLLRAYSIVRKMKPDVAVGVGGYASGPTLKVANWQGIPTVLQEQNSLPGVTNRLLGKRAKVICVAYDHMDRYFEANKIVFTGNPIRENIVSSARSREDALKFFNFTIDKKTVFITGGSLGARAINNAIASHLDQLVAQDIQVIWQTGKTYVHELRKYENQYPELVKIYDFIPDMDLAYSACDIVVSRAGGTISELAILGKPSILLPSPNVAEDHQTKNIMALVDLNAAILIKDEEANETLCSSIISLIYDQAKLETLSQNIKKIARPNAAHDIASQILKLIH